MFPLQKESSSGERAESLLEGSVGRSSKFNLLKVLIWRLGYKIVRKKT